jgi:phosphoribosylamine--glycine ligase
VNVLILGSGGREHAFAHALSKSKVVDRLFIAPGNAGTASCGTNLSISPTHFDAVFAACREYDIDILLPGPEDPLVKGISDFIGQASSVDGGKPVYVCGPSAAAARLEGSKDHSKAFMQRHGIPTAAYQSFGKENLAEGKAFLSTLRPPYVLKADGLAAGKGVLILDDLTEAGAALDEMILSGRFGTAGERVVIEEFLHGIEISVFAISDGINWQVLGSAKDYKRIGDGDTGPNTGGMGAVSPVPFADEAFMKKVRDRILEPTFRGLLAEDTPFTGFLFVGLMNCGGDPYVIEYNVRMGDPETEVVIPRLTNDFGEILQKMQAGRMEEISISNRPETAVGVVLVSGGYPGDYAKGKAISVNQAEIASETICYHAGTAEVNGSLCTSGGRVLVLTSCGRSIEEAAAQSYQAAAAIGFEGMNYRSDIGKDLIALSKTTE